MAESLKILMLEDNVVDAEILQQFLLQHLPGCKFSLVMTEEEYLEGLEHFEPDLILSDNTLPQFNATEALKLFKERSLSIPFILVTGTVSEEFAVSIMKLGADDYVLKDRLVRLPAAIEAALKKKKAEALAKNSEETRKLIMNAALDAIVCIDTHGAITVWNPQAEKLFGWMADEVMGRQVSELIIPEKYRQAHNDGFSHYLKTGEGPVLNKLIEVSAMHQNGNEFPIELVFVAVGQPDSQFFCAFIRDITERKTAEQRLRFKANLLNTVGQAVMATDLQGDVIYWNRAAEKIYGWTEAEAIGKSIIDLTPAKQSREQAIEILEELKKGNTWSGEFLGQRKSGNDFPALITFSPVYEQNEKLTGIIGVSIDITEQKKAELAFRTMEKRIADQKILEQKHISSAIIKAQEEEKNRIGLELHDNINQILAGTKLHLGVAASKGEDIRELLQYPMELIDSTIEELRLLSSRQVTPLKNINLEELIRMLIDILNTTGIHTDFSYSVPDELLSDDLKLNIYRLMQEQVNNIVKHAKAKNVSVQVKGGLAAIFVVVTDNGTGFNTEKKRTGIGISNMMNRIEFYHGTLSIESEPGKGCRISITIPC